MDQFLDSISESTNKLIRWINHSYLGWDPYDGLNTIHLNGLQKIPDILRIVIIQVNRVSPINLRPILSIEKGIDTKGISIFLQGYCKLNNSGIPGPLEEDGTTLYSRLIKENILFDNTISWSSHYFNYIGVTGSILTPNTPDLIGTTNVIKAICQYSGYRTIDIENIIEKYYNYLINNFDRNHGCFMYGHHIKDKYVPNCDAEVISSYRYVREIVENEGINEICLISLKKILNCQNPDGSWDYSFDHDGRNIYKQFDFHQGYIINGLIDSISIYPNMKEIIMSSIEKAVNFYDSMFDPEGRGYYRYPRRYPTDIHNQAQGIITYSKLHDSFKEARFYDMSKKICRWTIENMQDKDGHFYYQKGRILANRIPYMRWNQAWMMLALSCIRESILTENP
jgi:hypothetical protein